MNVVTAQGSLLIENICNFPGFLCYNVQELWFGGAMQRGLFLAVAMFLSFVPLLSAQAGSARDLRADERELQRYQWQLQQDRNRLAFDRRNHATHWRINEDKAQIRSDQAAIRSLRADMRRDRQIRRRRYRTL